MTDDLKHDLQLRELYRTERTALIDYAASIVGGRAQAEDVVQDAYLRFAALEERDRPHHGPIARPKGYFRRIVRNLAIDWIRRRAAEREVALKDAAFEAMPAPAPTPEDHVRYKKELQVVTLALAELPERTRIAFEMHRLGGRTFHDIAGILGISVGLAHRLVREAITHCARRLDEPCRPDPPP